MKYGSAVGIVGLLSLAMNGWVPIIAHAQACGFQCAAPGKADYVLFVEVKVKPETVDDFKEALLSRVAPTRIEDGNLAYIAHQSPDDPTDFIVDEHWKTDDAHTRHLNRANVCELF